MIAKMFCFGSNLIYVVLLVHLTSRVSSQNRSNLSVLDILTDGYDKEIRPFDGVKPVHVLTNGIIDSIGVIDEASMEFTIYLYFHQYWTDDRLAGKINQNITITGQSIGRFWKPDPYCYNARKSNLMAEDKDIRSRLSISTNGDMFYSRSTVIIASCFMHLHDFPLDSQKCHLKFGSYSQGDKKILFGWKVDNISVMSKSIAQFHMDKVNLKTETGFYVGENFTTVNIEFILSRRVGYYIIQAYCPDILIVVLSWIILWMDTQDMGDRMALGITTILTIMFLLGATNASMPKVSYPKALDWYLLVSFAFVFMTLIESMIVFLLAKKNENKKTAKTRRQSNLPYKCVSILLRSKAKKFASPNVPPQTPNMSQDKINCFVENDAHSTMETELPCKKSDGHWENPDESIEYQRPFNCGEKVDRFSRILFPLAFIVFNLTYWYTYLFKNKE